MRETWLDELRQLFRERDEQFEKHSQQAEVRFQQAEARLQKLEELMAQSHLEMAEGFKELRARSKEIDRRFDQTEQFIKENAQKAEQRAQEAEQRSKEIDRRFDQTAQFIKENAQRMRETDQKVKELSELFTGQWGKLIEALVEPGSVQLFTNRDINVTRSTPNVKGHHNGNHIEIDILLENRVEEIAVVVEVKTTLGVDDVRDFLETLDTFLDFFPEYQGYTIYGAVAGVKINRGVGEFAYRSGLFVLGVGREGLVRMLNNMKFDPRDFGEIA